MPNSEEEAKIAIERLRQIPPTMVLNIGGRGSFTRDELIDHIKNRTEIGDIVVKMQMMYLRSFKEEVV